MRWVLLLLAAVVATPLSAAQPAPELRVTIDGVPAAPVSASGSNAQGLTLKFALKNVVCTTAARFTAAITATAAEKAAGNASSNQTGGNTTAATVSVAPASLSFDVPAGPYGSAAPAPGKDDSKTFVVSLTPPNLTRPVEYKVTVTATVPAGSGADCRSTGSNPAATDTKDYTVAFGANTPPSPTPSPKLPLPPLVALAGIGLAALVMRRRARA